MLTGPSIRPTEISRRPLVRRISGDSLMRSKGPIFSHLANRGASAINLGSVVLWSDIGVLYPFPLEMSNEMFERDDVKLLV